MHLPTLRFEIMAEQLEEEGRYEEAEAFRRKALTINQTVLPESHPTLVYQNYNLGLVSRYQGKLDDANDFLVRSLELARAAFGAADPDVHEIMRTLNCLRTEMSTNFDQALAGAASTTLNRVSCF